MLLGFAALLKVADKRISAPLGWDAQLQVLTTSAFAVRKVRLLSTKPRVGW